VDNNNNNRVRVVLYRIINNRMDNRGVGGVIKRGMN
jgi:hypothetical protein